MAIRIFSVPAHGNDDICEQMNQFLRTQRIVSVERHLVSDNGSFYWSFCVDYLERSGNHMSQNFGTAARSSKPRIDYREILTDAEFVVFAKLRDLRKELAADEAIPVYAVLTNEQLAAIARSKVQSKADLKQVSGVGEGRLEKYGDRILACIQESPNPIST